ncbi:hypothetical protein BH09MYX1_BH09MYX1_46530 [soil metagenome]
MRRALRHLPPVRRPRRPKLFSPESVDAILARAGEDRFAPDRAPISGPLWRTIVGPRVADRAIPVKIEKDMLVIRVATSAWAQELSLLSTTILARLKEYDIDLKRLTFRTGPIDPPQRPPERRRSTKVPPPAPLPASVSKSVEGVADEELRAAIRGAIAQSLATANHVLATTESPRGARAPRSAGPESDPPARGSATAPEETKRSRGGAGDRSR